jgi:hypothetical protein
MICALLPLPGEAMGFQWSQLPQMHPVIIAVLLAHVSYSIYGNFVPNHETWLQVRKRFLVCIL